MSIILSNVSASCKDYFYRVQYVPANIMISLFTIASAAWVLDG